MERVIKYIKSGPDAVLNGICAGTVLVSIWIYKSFEFTCPCVPGYNMPYGLYVMFAPPLVFFFVGIIVNQYCTILTLEYSRPEGKREKSKAILRKKFMAIMIRTLAAPILWILICLLDGKPVVCAFSETVNPEKYGGFKDFQGIEEALLLSKVPCKNYELLRSSKTRKAISRFLKFLSQIIGYVSVITFIIIGSLARIIGPFFKVSGSLQNRYWSRYTDMEDKCFDETCIQHNRRIAERCINKYFKDVERIIDDEEKQGTYPDQLLEYLDKWYHCRPPIGIENLSASQH
ncbi:calcium homeostasis modulator protein 3-like [Bombina bombina]|uniref:calcium homeostasis modulator protein 3-like n=1 Tax=Bombina bombina TaxID=8345 RepID=UPI00235AF9BC|nr:calcium homeostasis modulator protein 3-like [Bombina bombina]XP_053548417.1 calcium homeostasis modulator protein 3-like [Bombina bombina]XP_053548418.1 calcium homeostasis modulator protein 3-like [Bombina bombina]